MCALCATTPAVAIADSYDYDEDYDYDFDYDTDYAYDSTYGYGYGSNDGSRSDSDSKTTKETKKDTTTSNKYAEYSSISWERLSGTDRYKTMESIVSMSFDRNKEAIIASGENYPDALCANALAGVLKCPVILTKQYNLTPEAKAMLGGLKVEHAYIVGGAGAVSEGIESEVSALGIKVERVSGTDRQSTSVNVMRTLRTLDSTSDTVIVSSGLAFADALSIGPWAYASKSPILLTGAAGTLTDEQVAEIRANTSITRVVIVGGANAVSPDVETQLQGLKIERLGGANRYETSANIAKWATSPGQGMSYKTPVVASGKNFPDALAGGPFAGELKSVLVLADDLEDPTLSLLRDNAKIVTGGFVLGGRQAMPWSNPMSGSSKNTNFKSSKDLQGFIDYMVTACTVWNLGYDQDDRWNVYDGGECDCSSLVYTALWEKGLLPKREADEELWGFTGTLAEELLENGWTMLPGDISLAQPGDILLNEGLHVAVVVSGSGENAKVAEAKNDENSVGVGGSTGDQTQHTGDQGETDVVDIYEFYNGWDMILRLEA